MDAQCRRSLIGRFVLALGLLLPVGVSIATWLSWQTAGPLPTESEARNLVIQRLGVDQVSVDASRRGVLAGFDHPGGILQRIFGDDDYSMGSVLVDIDGLTLREASSRWGGSSASPGVIAVVTAWEPERSAPIATVELMREPPGTLVAAAWLGALAALGLPYWWCVGWSPCGSGVFDSSLWWSRCRRC